MRILYVLAVLMSATSVEGAEYLVDGVPVPDPYGGIPFGHQFQVTVHKGVGQRFPVLLEGEDSMGALTKLKEDHKGATWISFEATGSKRDGFLMVAWAIEALKAFPKCEVFSLDTWLDAGDMKCFLDGAHGHGCGKSLESLNLAVPPKSDDEWRDAVFEKLWSGDFPSLRNLCLPENFVLPTRFHTSAGCGACLCAPFHWIRGRFFAQEVRAFSVFLGKDQQRWDAHRDPMRVSWQCYRLIRREPPPPVVSSLAQVMPSS